MKIMFICKKHYKQLMDEFKPFNPQSAVNGVLDMPGMNWNLRGFAAIDYQIHIKPYLKKIKILDVGTFELQMPRPELNY